MRGRKPVIRPLGDVVDLPSSIARTPACPSHLKGRECERWQKTSEVLTAKNIYDVDTEDVLVAYCVQYARFLDAEDKIREYGITTTGSHGGTVLSSWVAASNQAYDRLVRLAGELGLTPVSRNRVTKARGVKGSTKHLDDIS